MAVMRWVLVVGLIAGCGRLGFDPLAGDPGGADVAIDSGAGGGSSTSGGADANGAGVPSNHYITGGTASRTTPAMMTSTTTGPLDDANMVLVVAIHWGDTTSSITTVQDGFGNGWTSAGSLKRFNGAQSQMMWFKKISAGATINVYFDAAAPQIDLKWAAYREIDQTSPVDGAVAGSGTSTIATTGTATLNRATVIVAAAGSRAPTAVAGPGFTERQSSAGGVLEDLDSEAGVVSATATLSSSNDWIIQLVALRPL